MFKYKILLILFVLNCVFICCLYGNTISKYKKYVLHTHISYISR
jgi:hypothetical protein